MRKVETIIKDLRNQIYWSQPNVRFNELTNLINELENTLFPTEELPTPEPEVILEPIVEEVVEESVVEETIVEINEEPTTEETVTTKRGAKKK